MATQEHLSADGIRNAAFDLAGIAEREAVADREAAFAAYLTAYFVDGPAASPDEATLAVLRSQARGTQRRDTAGQE